MMSDDYLQQLKRKAAELPLNPGVYQFINSDGKVIYVGKAKNLRKRVVTYFAAGKDHSAKVRVMVRHIRDIRYIIVESESEALLLENNLIKTIQPRYNVMLKDDKTYPWIVVRNEHFPRVQSTRRLAKDGSRYFGPYSSVVVQRNVLELINGIYQLRTCSLDLSPAQIAKNRYGVCLQYHLGNCKGPCVGLQSEQDYLDNMQMIVRTLSGDLRSTRRYLTELMERSASDMNFEAANKYKLRLNLLDRYSSNTVIVSASITDIDVFSMLKDTDAVYCNYMKIVGGAVINSFTAQLTTGIEEDDTALLTHAVRQISDSLSGPLAKEVLVPFLPDVTLFPEVKFTVPQRGEKLKLLEYSQRSAKMYRMERLRNMEIRDPARHTERILEAMSRELRLDKLPRHIECFDNSNFHGTYPVASCVVFRDAKPSRKEYRHFNVKTVVGPDDFASMREIVRRRYRRLLDEGAGLPDLVIVDGGKGQLSSAYSVFRELGIEERVPVIGLAKRIEEVYYPHDPDPYYLERTGEPLKVIMHIRNEAHRFGITFHRKKRSLDFIKTELRSIPGLGEKSVTALLQRFKTVSAVKRASEEELAAVVGPSRARALREYYSSEGSNVGPVDK